MCCLISMRHSSLLHATACCIYACWPCHICHWRNAPAEPAHTSAAACPPPVIRHTVAAVLWQHPPAPTPLLPLKPAPVPLPPLPPPLLPPPAPVLLPPPAVLHPPSAASPWQQWRQALPLLGRLPPLAHPTARQSRGIKVPPVARLDARPQRILDPQVPAVTKAELSTPSPLLPAAAAAGQLCRLLPLVVQLCSKCWQPHTAAMHEDAHPYTGALLAVLQVLMQHGQDPHMSRISSTS